MIFISKNMQPLTKLLKSVLIISFLIFAVSAIRVRAETFTVTNANDSGAGSLRNVLTQANTNAQADTINFDPAFFNTARTIVLASEIQITADGTNPGRAVTINGPGANLLTVSGNNATRVFYLPSNSNVSMNGMTLRDGNGVGSDGFYDRTGGAIVCAQCSLTLMNMVIRNNTVTRDGGGLHSNNGTLTISDSIFRENVANSGGGFWVSGEANRQLTITNSQITENNAGYVGGIFAGGNMVKTIRNTTISNNVVFHRIGGAQLENGTLTLANCQITGNRAGVPNVPAAAGAASVGGLGLFFGTATITDTLISNNTAGVSPANSPGGIIGITGGVSVDRTAVVFRRVTVSGNLDYAQQTNGGAGMQLNSVTGFPITVIDSLVSNNRHSTIANGAAHGAGIATGNSDGLISIINTTITGNVAEYGLGGGIFNFTNGLKIINSTIAGNTSTFNDNSNNEDGGGGIYTFPNRAVTIQNSIIAGNTGPTGPDVTGTFISNGYNIIGNTANSTGFGAAGDKLNTNPLLGALQNNGGATLTIAPQPGSPAVNAGNNALAIDENGNLLTFDQRGSCFERFVGGAVDIGAFETGATAACGSSRFDFDGDGRDDVSVYRASNGTWYLQQSQNGFTGIQFGASFDRIVPADYDGDGKTDVAVFRSGVWYLNRSQTGFTGVSFGEQTDIPVPADYDGDGKADVAVFRPLTGTWYLLRSQLGFIGIQFGQQGDKPVAADYDGDGKSDIAVYRSGVWYINRSQLGFTGVSFGEANDTPTPADYDGDGKTDIAVFRPSNGVWYLNRSQAGFTGIQFGAGGDFPVPADYDGDGRADVSVFRNGVWYLNRSQSGFTGISFGAGADKPIPNAFVPQ